MKLIPFLSQLIWRLYFNENIYFSNQNLYLEYRYAALNNIAIDLICRFLLGRPIPRAAFYICSMYKWLTSSVTDGSVNQIRFFGSRNIHFKISQNFTKKIIVVMGHRSIISRQFLNIFPKMIMEIFFFVKLILRLFWSLGKHLLEFFLWNQKLVINLSAITMSLVQGFHFLARKRPEAAGTMVSLKRPGSSFVPWWKAEAVTLAL